MHKIEFLVILVYMEKVIDFDFSEIIQRLEPILEEAKTLRKPPHSDIPNFIRDRLFVFPEFANYLARYTETHELKAHATGYLIERGYRPPHVSKEADLHILSPFNRLASKKPDAIHLDDQGIRDSQSYFLNEEELGKAHDYLKENPTMMGAVAGLQGGVVSYLDDLFVDMRQHYASRQDNQGLDLVNTLSQRYGRNADSPAFLQDMMTVVAEAMAKNSADLSPQAFSGTLKASFAKQLFRSSGLMPGETERQNFKCPFSGAFAKVMSIKLSQGEDGNIVAAAGDFGDTLLSLQHKMGGIAETAMALATLENN